MEKILKRLSVAILCALLCLPAVSCGKGNDAPDDYVKIVDNGKTTYRIVRSDMTDVGGSAAAKLRGILDTVTDESVKLMNDFENEKLGTMRIDTEILVGPTNRDESSMHKRSFTYLDYAIDMDTTRLSITGGSSEALVMAVEYIGENFVYADTKTVAVPKGTVYEYYHDYPIDKFTIGGEKIENYVIVAKQGDTRATEFANSFRTAYGKTPTVVSADYKDRTPYEIILSSAGDERYADVFAELDDFEYMYRVEGTKIYIGTNGMLSDDAAWDMFMEEVLGGGVASLTGNVAISDCENIAAVPHAERIIATEENLDDVDKMAREKKEYIMSTPNIEIPTGAVVYYVSPNGDDANDGRTPDTAWQTLSRVNGTEFSAGSYVLFERGGIWRGQISAKAGVTYSAYGEGAKPALYGGHEDGAIPEKWTLMEGTDNIWIYADEMIDSGTLVFNHGEMHAYKEIPSYIDGGFKKRKAPEEEFDIIEALDVDLDFFQAADSVLTAGKYPTSGTAVGEIYLRCDAGNPGEVFDSIEFVPRRNGFAVGGDNVTIDNFTVKYIGAHGVGAGTRAGLTVQNCEFGWIGGGIQSYAANGNTTQSATRFGNAIEIYGGCQDFTVHDNYIWQVYDAGITHQYKSEKIVKQSNVSYYNNLVENCVYSIEYFLNASDNPEQSMYNIKIHDNILRYAGFGWGNQRPDKGSQAHIKGWDHDNPAVDFEIYNNILDRSANWMIHCGYGDKAWEPVIRDNIFIQYSDGLFGKYDVNPTPTVAYSNAMLSDERLVDNMFFFIEDDNVRYFTGDRGILALKHKGLPIYREGDYIELHGEKITDEVQIAALTSFFDAAVENAALFTGFGGACGELTTEYGDATYEQFTSCATWEELERAASSYFDPDIAGALINAKVGDLPLFITADGVLYRYGGYAAQYAYTDASRTVKECYLGTDGTISLVVHITSDIPGTVECDTVYKVMLDETGAYKLTSSFALPIELITAYMS